MSEELDAPDMTNKLAILRHKNIRQMMADAPFTASQLAEKSGLGVSTLQQCLAKTFKRAISERNLTKLYEGLPEVVEGAFDHADFAYVPPPPIIQPPKKVFCKIGRMEFYLSKQDANRVLTFLALEE